MNASILAEDNSPEKFWSRYFPSEKMGDMTTAAKVVVDSNLVFGGTIKITDNKKDEAKGTIELNELLYGSSSSLPSAITFQRLTNTNAQAFIESKLFAPFYGWFDRPMDGASVVVFLRRRDEQWEIRKVVPVEDKGGRHLVAELKLLQNSKVWKDSPNRVAILSFDPEYHPLADAVVKRLKQRTK